MCTDCHKWLTEEEASGAGQTGQRTQRNRDLDTELINRTLAAQRQRYNHNRIQPDANDTNTDAQAPADADDNKQSINNNEINAVTPLIVNNMEDIRISQTILKQKDDYVQQFNSRRTSSLQLIDTANKNKRPEK